MILPLKQLNYLREFWSDPCDAPLTIYAKAFFPAALTALITWFTPDITNILFNAAKPVKAIARRRSGSKFRSGSKGGRGRGKRSKLNPLNFDQDEFIGKRIGATTSFAGRTIGNAEFRLWMVYGVLERIGLWIMIINLTADFFYNWMTLAEKSEFCQAQRNLIVLRERVDLGSLSILGWYGFYCPILLKQRGLVAGYSSVSVPAGQWVTMSGGGSFEPVEGEAITMEIRIQDGNGAIFAEGSTTGQPGEGGEVAVEARVRGPRLLTIQHRVSYPCRVTGAWSAHGIPSPV